MPSFPGGELEMQKFLKKNIQYPAMEQEAGIQGTVYVTFVVDKDGNINNVEILRGVSSGPNLGKEALRVVKMMPSWKASFLCVQQGSSHQSRRGGQDWQWRKPFASGERSSGVTCE